MIKQAEELQALTDELLHLGEDGEVVYIDQFRRLNQEIREKAGLLFLLQSEDIEQEAQVCLSLIMVYSVIAYQLEDKEEKIQVILDRCNKIFVSDFSLSIRCKLLLYCYEQLRDNTLVEEAYHLLHNNTQQYQIDDRKKLLSLYQEIVECKIN